MTEDDYQYEHIIQASLIAVRVHHILNWLIRAAISIPLLALLAIILKWTLIEPYSAINVDMIIEFEEIHSGKGDRQI